MIALALLLLALIALTAPLVVITRPLPVAPAIVPPFRVTDYLAGADCRWRH